MARSRLMRQTWEMLAAVAFISEFIQVSSDYPMHCASERCRARDGPAHVGRNRRACVKCGGRAPPVQGSSHMTHAADVMSNR
jgi:hypothetical protein